MPGVRQEIGVNDAGTHIDTIRHQSGRIRPIKRRTGGADTCQGRCEGCESAAGGSEELVEIYPLTITMDRYNGTYSKGKYLAWRLDVLEVPQEPFSDDVTCMKFWEEYKDPVGIGDTPDYAIENLKTKLMHKAIKLQREYGGPLNGWVDAVECCDDEKSAYEYMILRFGEMK